jgi:hypothetical protein
MSGHRYTRFVGQSECIIKLQETEYEFWKEGLSYSSTNSISNIEIDLAYLLRVKSYSQSSYDYGEYWGIDLTSDGKKIKVVKRTDKSHTTGFVSRPPVHSNESNTETSVTDRVYIRFGRKDTDNKDLTERITRAFENSISLCANKRKASSEPF